MLMKKKYAICGVSGRALGMFAKPILTTYAPRCELVALLDTDPERFELFRTRFPEHSATAVYGEEEFDRMIEETKPDVVIVAGRDDTHARYIVAALEHDRDVITEKPMVTTGADARRVLEAERASKGNVTVTFNYRYAPVHDKIKEMVWEGRLGRITSVDLNWYLDTYHGASYFKDGTAGASFPAASPSTRAPIISTSSAGGSISGRSKRSLTGPFIITATKASLTRSGWTAAIAAPARQQAAVPTTRAGMRAM